MQMLGVSGTGGLGHCEADSEADLSSDEADLSRAATDYHSDSAVKQANMLADMVRDASALLHQLLKPSYTSCSSPLTLAAQALLH